jgi:hypothetical protein
MIFCCFTKLDSNFPITCRIILLLVLPRMLSLSWFFFVLASATKSYLWQNTIGGYDQETIKIFQHTQWIIAWISSIVVCAWIFVVTWVVFTKSVCECDCIPDNATVLCRLVGRDSCPKLELLCKLPTVWACKGGCCGIPHNRVCIVTTAAWDMDHCQPTCKALYLMKSL